jgi:hypothetical protein
MVHQKTRLIKSICKKWRLIIKNDLFWGDFDFLSIDVIKVKCWLLKWIENKNGWNFAQPATFVPIFWWAPIAG